MRYLILLLILASCAPTYHPQLITAPNDPSKYEQDRKDCLVTAENITGKTYYSLAGGLLGGIGAGIASLNDPMTNEERDIKLKAEIDKCVESKGYKLIK